MEHIVEATNKYVKASKHSPAMYLSSRMSPFTKDETLWHIAVLLLLSVNSVRCYQKAMVTCFIINITGIFPTNAAVLNK